MSIEAVMPSNHLIHCHPLCLLPSVFPSTRVFFSELTLHVRWPACWSFSISHSNEYSPAPLFDSINYSVLSLLYGPTLTTLHDYWGNHSFDYTVHCQLDFLCPFFITITQSIKHQLSTENPVVCFSFMLS